MPGRVRCPFKLNFSEAGGRFVSLATLTIFPSSMAIPASTIVPRIQILALLRTVSTSKYSPSGNKRLSTSYIFIRRRAWRGLVRLTFPPISRFLKWAWCKSFIQHDLRSFTDVNNGLDHHNISSSRFHSGCLQDPIDGSWTQTLKNLTESKERQDICNWDAHAHDQTAVIDLRVFSIWFLTSVADILYSFSI